MTPLTPSRWRRGLAARRRCCRAWWDGTARAATLWCGTATCRLTWPQATCSRWRRRARTAGRWPRTTTTSPSLAWWRCVTVRPSRSSAGRRSMTCCGWMSDEREASMSGGKPLKVALLGCGVVGSQVARLLSEEATDLAVRVGARLELAGIAVRRLSHARPGIDPALLTTDAVGLATRPDVDIVVEVIGGIEPARSLLLAAMKNGKSAVTANKVLLAEQGEEIHEASREHGADLYYEASVAGAIPLLRPLRESLAGDTVHRVLGIVNGTTNFILDRMDTSGADFTDALEEAQALGYAEADPTADIEGFDAAAKATILAGLAFHTRVTAADVHREGITEVWKARPARMAAFAAASKDRKSTRLNSSHANISY